MTYKKAEANMARNNVIDRIFQGVAAFVILALAFQDLTSRYINNDDLLMRMALGAGFIVVVLWALVSPMFRD